MFYSSVAVRHELFGDKNLSNSLTIDLGLLESFTTGAAACKPFVYYFHLFWQGRQSISLRQGYLCVEVLVLGSRAGLRFQLTHGKSVVLNERIAA